MSHNEYYDIVIIGAGASGLLSACLLACSGKSILVLEKEDRVGRKLSATGNGRCNLTNMNMSWKNYYGDKEFVSSVLERVSPARVIDTFNELGVLTREKDGYVYPHSNQAQTVIGALYKGCRKPNVHIELSARVTDVWCEDAYDAAGVAGGVPERFRDNEMLSERDIIDVDESTGQVIHAPARFEIETDTCDYGCETLILATGGPAGKEQGGCADGYSFLKKLGHSVTDVYPGLTGMNAAGRFWKGVAGTRVQGSFSLYVDGMLQGTETGEIQITKTGVSGIPVFQMCRVAAEGLAADKPVWGVIDFVPTLSQDECERWVSVNGFDGLVPSKWLSVIGNGQKSAEQIAKTLKRFEFTITDTYGIEKAQVSAGGVPVSEVSEETFESKCCPGLYVLGELMDIDGMCGGYNLHLAWASAMISSESILRTCGI